MTSIVLIGGSAGSINALKVILNGLPADFPAPVLVVSHIGSRESILGAWDEAAARLKINVRHGHEVTAIRKRDDGSFELKCGNGAVVGIDRYGESAPAGKLFEFFGFTPEHVAEVARSV